jgi:hypothetical protein
MKSIYVNIVTSGMITRIKDPEKQLLLGNGCVNTQAREQLLEDRQLRPKHVGQFNFHLIFLFCSW